MYNFYVYIFYLKQTKIFKTHFQRQNSTFSKIFIISVYCMIAKIVHLQNKTFPY
jgi:hypothetical protein